MSDITLNRSQLALQRTLDSIRRVRNSEATLNSYKNNLDRLLGVLTGEYTTICEAGATWLEQFFVDLDVTNKLLEIIDVKTLEGEVIEGGLVRLKTEDQQRAGTLMISLREGTYDPRIKNSKL